MTAAELEDYLHEHMPLTAAMGLRVVSADADRVVVDAPLDPNRNHRGTVFGGSIASLAIAAGWSLVFLRLCGEAIVARVVIQRATVDYLSPAEGFFQAEARGPEPADWETFCTTFRRRGRARLGLTVIVTSNGVSVAQVNALFVALPGGEMSP